MEKNTREDRFEDETDDADLCGQAEDAEVRQNKGHNKNEPKNSKRCVDFKSQRTLED